MISKRTNLSLAQYSVAFACTSHSHISGKWGWLDRRTELDEKSAWSKSLTFILQLPGTRKQNLVDKMSQNQIKFRQVPLNRILWCRSSGCIYYIIPVSMLRYWLHWLHFAKLITCFQCNLSCTFLYLKKRSQRQQSLWMHAGDNYFFVHLLTQNPITIHNPSSH